MNGRSIQDIVPPARNKPIRPPGVSAAPPPPPPPPPSEFRPVAPQEPMKSSLTFVWIALGALVVAGAVVGLMSTVFHTAEARVTRMECKSDISGDFFAGPELPLTYSPVKASSQVTRTVPATGSVDASDRATGLIVVSNLYSAKPQRLITNTRFETSDGKVYRIHAPITIPGYTTRNGQKVAGTVEAQVYADQPGEAYNKDSATFKLPGLKGSNQYDLITATTKDALTGGFVGKKATVEKSVRDQAIAEMKSELERTLREKVLAGAPPQSVVLLDSVRVRYVERPDTAVGDTATLAMDGTAVVPAFPVDGLARELGLKGGVASDVPLMLMNPNDLTFSTADGALIEGGGTLTFTLSGMAHLRAVFNERSFAEDLAGKTRAEIAQVQAEYRGIAGSAELSVRPFWLSSLPKNPERIKVSVTGALDPTR